jgi:hypothetical protein
MRLRWHIPKRDGEPSGALPPARHTGQPRRTPIPASTDFNTCFSDSEDVGHGAGSATPCRDDDFADVQDQGEAEKRVLNGKIGQGWSLKLPLLIRIEREADGYFVASDDTFAVHGDGPTLRQAVKDYAASLIEYYQLLSSYAQRDESTAALFHRLQRYLEPAEE